MAGWQGAMVREYGEHYGDHKVILHSFAAFPRHPPAVPQPLWSTLQNETIQTILCTPDDICQMLHLDPTTVPATLLPTCPETCHGRHGGGCGSTP